MEAGHEIKQLTSCRDWLPTLIELCGLPKVEGLQGASITSLLRNPSAAWDRPAISVSYQQRVLGRSVRTEKWHYADWSDGREGAMLIDVTSDPSELKNLAGDPRHASVVAEMKRHLQRLPPIFEKR